MSEQVKVLCFFLSRKKSLSLGRCAGPSFLKKRSKKLLPIMCVVLFGGSAVAADGKYLARMADCAACHMGADGTLSGGRAFATPFGTIYATNITPDAKHGVGGYTDDEWVAALQRGVARGGKHLYPAMPYTNYTLMTRDDALAIKAYVMTLPASSAEPPADTMRFPFNIRWLMVFWNWLYNPNHRFTTDSTHDAAWNRGAYLAEALGHCQQCHTPRNFLQGPKHGQAYAGAVQQGWMAYNITSDAASGIGGWSQAEIATYLSNGHADGHGPASGPMAEAVSYSLRYLTGDDAQALAAYLKTIPAVHTTPLPPPMHVAEDELGARIYEGACASCHRTDGTGTETPLAALAGDQTAMDPGGTNLALILMTGGAVTTNQGSFAMPGFARGYTDTELAAVANYTIEHFGQRVGRVSPAGLAGLRGKTGSGAAVGGGTGS